MSAAVNIKPRDRLELLQIFIYIGERNIDAAERFLVAAEEAREMLAGMPGMRKKREFDRPDLANIRSWSIRGFDDYLIFYKPAVAADGIDVLRVLHGARDIDRLFDT